MSETELEKMRHTAAHILAAASTELKPETQLGVGPAIEDGFYHDIDVADNWSEDDLKTLEKKMQHIKKQNLPISHKEVRKEEARVLFSHDKYKLELIDELDEETVGVSVMGDPEKPYFVTLCKGGHVESTGKVGFFRLTRLAGVYWKGDDTRDQLQRIYGVLFASQEELDEHLQNLEEAKKRDHRKLGQELDLFTFSPLVGPGLPLFTPRGAVIRRELEEFVQSLQEPRGYQRVVIPHITKSGLYETSGHWEKFKDDLFHVKGKSDQKFVMKPMNCPHHTQIFASQKRSYRDLPLRYSEVTMVYRDEQVGELQGLSRVRAITQDDAHVFCRPDQVGEEMERVYEVIDEFYKAFSFGLQVRLSLRDPDEPEKYLGSDDIWKQSEEALRNLVRDRGVDFTEEEGEAAFYGPKLDFVAIDSLKREWQLATIQLDLNMPARFELEYTSEDGSSQTPVMIHRAVLGSLERFMAILLEHYAGRLPLWLSPTQVAILPISDDQTEYAASVQSRLTEVGVRSELDSRSESMGKKIREAEQMKIPVMLVIGKQEVEDRTVTARWHGKTDQETQSVDDFILSATHAIANKV